jgi:hypothetical protein
MVGAGALQDKVELDDFRGVPRLEGKGRLLSFRNSYRRLSAVPAPSTAVAATPPAAMTAAPASVAPPAAIPSAG